MNAKKIVVLSAATLVLFLLVFLEPLRFVDNLFYDLNFALFPGPAADSVVIVGLDPKSIGQRGALPWPRSDLARLIELIDSCQPRAIALDFLFPRRQDDKGNDSLRAVLSRAKNIVLPFRADGISAKDIKNPPPIPERLFTQRFMRLTNQDKLGNTLFYSIIQFGEPDSTFSRYARYGGFINVSTNRASQKLREVIHVIKGGIEYFPSFGLSAVAAYYGLKPDEFVLDGAPRVTLGARTLPLTSYAATSYVNFRSNAAAIPLVSACDVLTGTMDKTKLRGRLVFVGVTDPAGAADFFITPVRNQFPGVEVWATSALDIMQNAWVTYGGGTAGALNWLLVFLVFPGAALFFPYKKKNLSLLISCAAVVLSLGISFVLFRTNHYFWNPGNHVYAWVFSILWIAALKADPTLTHLPGLEIEPQNTGAADLVQPPRETGYLGAIPGADTALYAINKIAPGHYGPAQDAHQQETVPGTVVERTLTEAQRSVSKKTSDYNLDKVDNAHLQLLRQMCNGLIVSFLGSGGMADVYLIWNPRLEMYRAVKVLKPGLPSNLLSRFETEIRIFSKLNHPNIVHCYGAGEWYTLPCVEMEYINGASLDDVIQKCKALSPAQTLAVGVLLCRALSYAHRQVITIYGNTYNGVIHRDLKPANILISKGGRIKLADFGIARPEGVSLHTADASAVVGTLPYLAPEQLDAKPLSPKTDIYALGVTLYECVTGRRAFGQADMTALVKAKSFGTLEKPLTPSNEVPRRFVDIVNKAMAVDPAKRYTSAEEMGNDMEDCLRSMLKDKPYLHLIALTKKYWG